MLVRLWKRIRKMSTEGTLYMARASFCARLVTYSVLYPLSSGMIATMVAATALSDLISQSRVFASLHKLLAIEGAEEEELAIAVLTSV